MTVNLRVALGLSLLAQGTAATAANYVEPGQNLLVSLSASAMIVIGAVLAASRGTA